MLAIWFQSDESVYERECGNMPGFAVYYRYPNSQRVTYGQFIKVSSRYIAFMMFYLFFMSVLILCLKECACVQISIIMMLSWSFPFSGVSHGSAPMQLTLVLLNLNYLRKNLCCCMCDCGTSYIIFCVYNSLCIVPAAKFLSPVVFFRKIET